jgi:hypothetical protein
MNRLDSHPPGTRHVAGTACTVDLPVLWRPEAISSSYHEHLQIPRMVFLQSTINGSDGTMKYVYLVSLEMAVLMGKARGPVCAAAGC